MLFKLLRANEVFMLVNMPLAFRKNIQYRRKVTSIGNGTNKEVSLRFTKEHRK